MNKIAVIGGGPAGMTAAIFAAKAGAKVTLFERNDGLGKKLLLTGNGKCNFTNLDMHADYFSFEEGSNADKVLESFSHRDVCDFFALMGVLHIEKKGYFYPFTGQASTIQQALLHALETFNVEIITGNCIGKITCKKSAVQYDNQKITNNKKEVTVVSETNDLNVPKREMNIFEIHFSDKVMSFDKVILACGGKAAPKTGSDGFGYRLARGFGHTVSRTYPVLVQLVSDALELKMLAGVRCLANVSACVDGKCVAKDYGEVQMTDYGLSGIPVFHLSRFLAKEVEEGRHCVVQVDFLPLVNVSSMETFIGKSKENLGHLTLQAFLSGMVHSKVAEYVIKISKLQGETLLVSLDGKRLLEVLQHMKAWDFTITGHKGFENAQTTKGGVLLEEVKETMESKLVEGVFFAGEMLDVDADCGGYNLHWAWASGRMAGLNAAK